MTTVEIILQVVDSGALALVIILLWKHTRNGKKHNGSVNGTGDNHMGKPSS